MSWFEASIMLPISVIQVAPEGYLADSSLLKKLNDRAAGEITVGSALEPHLANADLIYTDCWPHAASAADGQRISELFLPYQITAGHLKALKEDALFLPCPPVTRGQEVSPAAMESPLCQNYRAKQYLLHSQNAVLEFVSSL
jgi:ornithine carbamoyltransferase